MNKFTRRELAAALSASAVLLSQPASAQPAQPAAQSLPANPAEELKAAETQIRDTAAQLDKFPLPMATEPVTVFKP